MVAQSTNNTERLAKRSRDLGILSMGTVIIPFLLFLLLLIFNEGGEGLILMLAGSSFVSFLMGFINGWIGCVVAIVALRKIKKENGANKLKRVAVIGLVLNVLGILLTPPLIYFIFHEFS